MILDGCAVRAQGRVRVRMDASVRVGWTRDRDEIACVNVNSTACLRVLLGSEVAS